jgi:hypothetical protein
MTNKIVEKLVSEGMTQEEAFEFVGNIEGANTNHCVALSIKSSGPGTYLHC